MSTDRTNGFSAKDDADWSALRYVLGEMSVDEADAYEELLATDSQACERVAASAGLTADLYTALQLETELELDAATGNGFGSRVTVQPSMSAASDWRSRSGLWAVVGLVAAVCLLAAGGLSLLPILDRQRTVSDNSDTGAGSLVAIWTDRSAESAPDAVASEVGGADRASADDLLSLTESDDAVGDLASDSVLIADDDYQVPGWLIAAVGGNWNPDGSPAEIREN
jgi:anti-sigma-K factor RskA